MVKFNLTKIVNLSVNNTNSGDGNETLNVKFEHDLEISFNSRYLIDVASQLDGENRNLFYDTDLLFNWDTEILIVFMLLCR